jgi:quercetin dioxygenase-like cupin family protein
MRVTRIYADAAGASHFADVEVDLETVVYAPPAPPLDVSAPLPAERVLLFEFPAGWHGDWHPTPLRQLYANLGGQLEVEVSDGEVRRLGPGDIVLVEDLAGRGHVTRVLGDGPSRGLFIHLGTGDTA